MLFKSELHILNNSLASFSIRVTHFLGIGWWPIWNEMKSVQWRIDFSS